MAALGRTIFYQADHPSAMIELRDVVQMLHPKFPDAADSTLSGREKYWRST